MTSVTADTAGPRTSHKEVELDVVRAFAILLAVGWHFNHVQTDNVLVGAILAPGAVFGWAGVDLFFVLSGFLVGRIILTEAGQTGGFDIRTFYIRRIFKLWPMLYVFLAAMIVGSGKPFLSFGPQIGLHVQNYFPPAIATHLWSLAVEEHFYLTLSIIIFALTAWRKSPSAIFYVCIVGIVIAPLARLYAVAEGVSFTAIQWQSHFRMDALAAGVLLAWFAVFKPETFVTLYSRKILLGVITVLGVAFLATVKRDSPIGSTVGYTVSYVASIAFMMLLYKMKRIDWQGAWAAPFSFLATISYALYIWHVPAAELVERGANRFAFHDPIVLLVLKYALAIALATIMTYLLEKPLLKVRDRYFRKRSPAEV